MRRKVRKESKFFLPFLRHVGSSNLLLHKGGNRNWWFLYFVLLPAFVCFGGGLEPMGWQTCSA
jgi:hypothetical protein